jgi:hypothetical protein
VRTAYTQVYVSQFGGPIPRIQVTDPKNNPAPAITESKPTLIQRIYPNPFTRNTVLEINNATTQDVTILLTDAIGNVRKQVFKGQLRAGKQSITVNGEGLLPGVYYIKVMGRSITENHIVHVVN